MKRLFIAILFVLSPALAFAQFVPQDISVQISPETPEPGDRVNFDIESFALDLNRSEVTWILDNGTPQRAVGQKVFSFTAGVAGTTHRVTIVVETPSGEVITQTITVSPSSVDLLWEAIDSHVPALYEGKALVAHDGGVRVVALPNFVDASGTQLNPNGLIYNWSLNNKVQQGASGIGRDSFTFGGPLLYRESLVTVDVESSNGTFRARRSIELEAAAPEVLFYVEDPLLGQQLNAAIVDGQIDLVRDEMIIRAEPYFFSELDNRSSVRYDWRVDGNEIITVGDRNEINLRRPEQGEGRSVVSLEVVHIDKILQFARSAFSAFYSETIRGPQIIIPDNSLFGL